VTTWQQAFRHQIAEHPTILQVAGVADEQAGGRRQRIDPVKEQREGGGGGGWRVDASADHDLRRGLTRQLLAKQLELDKWHHYPPILCVCVLCVVCDGLVLCKVLCLLVHFLGRCRISVLLRACQPSSPHFHAPSTAASARAGIWQGRGRLHFALRPCFFSLFTVYSLTSSPPPLPPSHTHNPPTATHSTHQPCG